MILLVAVLQIVLISLSTDNLLAVFQIAFRFNDFIGCRCNSLLILLVAGFDDLSYRQENICSKFRTTLSYFISEEKIVDTMLYSILIVIN